MIARFWRLIVWNATNVKRLISLPSHVPAGRRAETGQIRVPSHRHEAVFGRPLSMADGRTDPTGYRLRFCSAHPGFHGNHDSMKVTNGLACLWTPINVCDNDSRYMAPGAGVADAACVAQELCWYV